MAIGVAMVLKSSDTVSDPLLGADYSIQSKQVDAFQDEMCGDWEGIMYPLGVMYYFSCKTHAENCEKICGSWLLNLLQSRTVITMNITVQTQSSMSLLGLMHLMQVCFFRSVFTCLELEAQFWKHVDFFPCHYKMRPSDANELQAQLEWFSADGENNILYHQIWISSVVQ
ncbi:uncharacterized protein BJ212DRAFT_1298650 [Suillus subaureus]|uniref:Uncharacterized protein n=1 Tax=Suillus subaureus TaxID=48587 RepID=A0A9P7EE02_9AGAM|nr:uncharacterized protein BJ212DRAFT_1298650 [Suillus subaureus]KAG1818571.1 hypothetical protein BJ212DRAFT_1298650 [Suillus subaureus]